MINVTSFVTTVARWLSGALAALPSYHFIRISLTARTLAHYSSLCAFMYPLFSFDPS